MTQRVLYPLEDDDHRVWERKVVMPRQNHATCRPILRQQNRPQNIAKSQARVMSPEPPTPAAQYLRMSTEHQQYSIANQSAIIQQYGKEHGFQIVRTYTDEGKSGIVLQNRAGLMALLDDVVTRRAGGASRP